MNLNRLGHYFSPTGGTDNEGLPHGSCQTGLVVGPGDVATQEPERWVNLAIWTHHGAQELRTSVVIGGPNEQGESFHLNSECPWHR